MLEQYGRRARDRHREKPCASRRMNEPMRLGVRRSLGRTKWPPVGPPRQSALKFHARDDVWVSACSHTRPTRSVVHVEAVATMIAPTLRSMICLADQNQCTFCHTRHGIAHAIGTSPGSERDRSDKPRVRPAGTRCGSPCGCPGRSRTRSATTTGRPCALAATRCRHSHPPQARFLRTRTAEIANVTRHILDLAIGRSLILDADRHPSSWGQEFNATVHRRERLVELGHLAAMDACRSPGRT